MAADPRLEELAAWLGVTLGPGPHDLRPASVDASFRRYFRLEHAGRSVVVMDAPPPRETLVPFLKVARLLDEAGLKPPAILASDEDRGFALLEDLGMVHYLQCLQEGTDPDLLYRPAMAALVTMQAGIDGVRAGLPAYSSDLLATELGLFEEWFLIRHLGLTPTAGERAVLASTRTLLLDVTTSQRQVFVHRDYHSRNLMPAPDQPAVIDFQDAVVGPQAYDLVSLLKDCYVRWPRARVLGWLDHYLALAHAAGLSPAGGREDFVRDFDLTGLQRHLKVLGIFARLWHRDAKPGYLQDLPRVLDYAVETAQAEPTLQAFHAFLVGRVVPAFAAVSRAAPGASP
ncbi:MAG: aminoglycoside phosphotransferase family protein [Steroidobacteraceae bacterium]